MGHVRLSLMVSYDCRIMVRSTPRNDRDEMSTLASSLRVGAAQWRNRLRHLPNLYSVGVWLVASLIAVFFALLVRDSAVIDGALPTAR